MELLITLKIFVCVALFSSLLLGFHDRYVLQPTRMNNGEKRPEFYNQLYETIPLLMIGFCMIFFTLEQVLTAFTLFTIALVLIAKLYLKKAYTESNSIVLEQARSYVVILTVIWLIRSSFSIMSKLSMFTL